MVDILLKYGADVPKEINGESCLHWATIKNDIFSLKTQLNIGMNVNEKGFNVKS